MLKFMLIFMYLQMNIIDSLRNVTRCDNQVISLTNGFIASPKYPEEPVGEVLSSCTVRTPSDLVMTLRVVDGDVENFDSQCNCCNHLEVYSEGRVILKVCKREIPKPVLMESPTFGVRFRSNYSENSRGFALHLTSRGRTVCSHLELSCLDGLSCYDASQVCDGKFACRDHSDELNCGSCTFNKVLCNDNLPVNCFNPYTERCDGVLNCPMGEDELNCSKCTDKIQCRDGNGCYSSTQICDEIHDCSDGSDEEDCKFKFCALYPNKPHFMCNNTQCISYALVGNGVDDCGDGSDEQIKQKTPFFLAPMCFLMALLTMLFIFIICIWCRNRRDIRSLLANLPDFPLPPFRGPGESECLLFEETESLHQSEEMYESYRCARNETGNERRRSCGRSIRVRSARTNSSLVKCNSNCTAVTLASLGLTPRDCLALDYNCTEHSEPHFKDIEDSKKEEKSETQTTTSKVSSRCSSKKTRRTAKVSCSGDFEESSLNFELSSVDLEKCVKMFEVTSDIFEKTTVENIENDKQEIVTVEELYNDNELENATSSLQQSKINENESNLNKDDELAPKRFASTTVVHIDTENKGLTIKEAKGSLTEESISLQKSESIKDIQLDENTELLKIDKVVSKMSTNKNLNIEDCETCPTNLENT